ncbi:MAG: hypothetical protein ABJE66_38700 [Deltaproteobacteria bacterium]
MRKSKTARRDEDDARLEALRAELQKGIADLEAGRYITVDYNDIEAYVRSRGRRRS